MDQVTGQVIVQNPKAHGEKEKAFTFDTVFDGESKQVDVYNETARPIIEFALEGYNGKENPPHQFFFYFSLARHYICIWTDWNRKDIHHGGIP